MIREFVSAASKAAFEMSKETGTSIATILGGAAVLTAAVFTGVAQVIEAKNKYKKDEDK
jgi:hypothetical protein|nr:MAG TPA: hypothetical protein [Caudoviricetes sp.]